MRIATWNVNGLRARLDFFLHWLRARRPDVVGIQETKLADDQFPREALAAAGYPHAAVHGQKAWNGVAIVSRLPLTDTDAGLPGQQGQGARLLTAQVGDLTFTTLYCPNGKAVEHEDFATKLAWLDALIDHAEGSVHTARVLCGDFNLCPQALDSWDDPGCTGEIFHTAAERERFRRLLDLGYVDLFRALHPDARAFSWWDYRGGAFHRGEGLRIDLLLGSAAVHGRLRAVEIDRDYRKKKDGLLSSDHAPVIADLD